MMARPNQRRSGSRAWLIVLVVLIVAAALAGWGIYSRVHAQVALKQQTAEAAIPSVVTVEAKAGPEQEEMALPGNVQAEFDTPIFARTSGYLKAWYTDIGSVVKQGQLLAEIDTPDVDAQLHQAEADLATSVANVELARSTAKRWLQLVKTQSVSAQETDEKVSDAQAKEALVQSAEANVARLRDLEGFKRVLAPFDGVVTARETDVGALINAGGGQGPELFRVADKSKLRIYIQVPQSYASSIKPGMTMNLSFPEHPGRSFPAALVRTSGALNPTVRSLLVELQVDNAQDELLPGGYTEVHMTLPLEGHAVRIPVGALLFRSEGLRVATVGDDNKAHLNQITMGRDFGQEVEVATGIAAGARVITNPPDGLVEGETVRVETPPSDNKGQNNKGQNDTAQNNKGKAS
jgi:RND family efflux transporter MFP subunit